MARDGLAVADPRRFRAAIDRADDWLMKREVSSVTDASVRLLAVASIGSPTALARTGRRLLELLRRGQDDEGGGGPT